MEDTFQVRVDTPGGQRKTYSFDTLEEANTFVIGCEDKVVSGPTRTISLTEEED
jgi:hypothetical protein